MDVKRSKALAVSAGLSVLFLIVYGGCNWITARRPNVGTFYFEWERTIPFVPRKLFLGRRPRSNNSFARV